MSAKREIIFHIPSLQGGGAERVAVEIAKHFVARGYTPVFFIHAENQAAYRLPDEIEIVVSTKTGHLGRVVELGGLLRKRRPKALISFLTYANLISVLANLISGTGTRLVVSEHLALAFLQTAGAKARLKAVLAGWMYQASDSIVAVSTGVAEDLRAALKGRVTRKIVVVHNPCFVPGVAQSVLPAKRKGGALLAVGRLVDQKGFDVLIRAFAIVRNRASHATLAIAGEGPNRPQLEQLVRELRLEDSVRFLGFTKDTASLYRTADLFVCSSRFEGFGNVIVEALSFGLPVVSTRCPHGPEEILQEGRFGRLVPVGDEQRLASAVLDALASDVDAQVLIARATDFSLESVGNRYLEQAGLPVRDERAGERSEGNA